MIPEVFLIILALIWILFAVVQDVRTREIANWLNYSLIIFAIGFRFFYCLFSETGYGFFYQGLIWTGIFFVLANLFYYSKMFAGGDAKLFFALGAIIPFSSNFYTNLKLFCLFLLLFLFIGAAYGLIISIFLIIKNFKNFKKEFLKQFNSHKNIFYLISFLALIIMVLGFIETFIFYLGLLLFLLPYFYFSAKAVEEVCMVRKISCRNLTEGDWLYENTKVGNKTIKKDWDGLTKKDIQLLQKKKFVLIRQGIPFSPVFLIAFLTLICLWFSGLWDKIFLMIY